MGREGRGCRRHCSGRRAGDYRAASAKHVHNEIYALALRKAGCEITCSLPAKGVTGESLSTKPVDLDAMLLAREEPRTFNRRDGTTGEMMEAVIGDADVPPG